MTAPDYVNALQKARVELAELLRKREELEVSIAKQKRKVAAWSELCDESEYSDATALGELIGLDLGGLTEACKTAMRASRKEWMTIAEILAALKELGFPLEKYKAPAASVTTTINRLVEAKEVIPDKHPGGAHEYKWAGPLDQALQMYGLPVGNSQKRGLPVPLTPRRYRRRAAESRGPRGVIPREDDKQ